jgi:hypothetical protein
LSTLLPQLKDVLATCTSEIQADARIGVKIGELQSGCAGAQSVVSAKEDNKSLCRGDDSKVLL